MVIVCISAKEAENLSHLLRSSFQIDTIVNESMMITMKSNEIIDFSFEISEPYRGSPKVFICSDDYLAKFDVKTANHIIHYDLPNDFDTFSQRYSVLRSNITFEVYWPNCSFIFLNFFLSSNILFRPIHSAHLQSIHCRLFS